MTRSKLYSERYYRGCGAISSYKDYLVDAYGPSRMLGDTIARVFKPTSALDVGCAVGFTVKRLRELGIDAFGCDLSRWAVETADVPYVFQCDVTQTPIRREADIVYAYDVVEHIPEPYLDYAFRNMWTSCRQHLLVVPDLFEEGTETDLRDITHVTFHDREWWISRISTVTASAFNEELSRRMDEENHSRVFNYKNRLFVFSKS